MKLSDETKQTILETIPKYTVYATASKAERQKKGMFFTPPELIIKMLERFSNLDGTVFDPCAGSGSLIIGAIIAGADHKKCYANEIDPAQYEILKNNLMEFGVPEENIMKFDALGNELYDHLAATH